MSDILDMLSSGATHHAAEHAFTEAGWRPCGAGDWAIENRDESVAELVEIVRRIHEHALRELPWCGPGDAASRETTLSEDFARRRQEIELAQAELTLEEDPALMQRRAALSSRFFGRSE